MKTINVWNIEYYIWFLLILGFEFKSTTNSVFWRYKKAVSWPILVEVFYLFYKRKEGEVHRCQRSSSSSFRVSQDENGQLFGESKFSLLSRVCFGMNANLYMYLDHYLFLLLPALWGWGVGVHEYCKTCTNCN